MNYYELLHVTDEFDAKQLKRAYFAAIKRYPPERDPDMFKLVKTAYDTLGDKTRREAYDKLMHLPDEAVRQLDIILELDGCRSDSMPLKRMMSLCEQYPSDLLLEKLAGMYTKRGMTGKAISTYEKLSRQDDGPTMARLGWAYFKRGWKKKAANKLSEAMKVDGQNLEVLSYYVSYLFEADTDYRRVLDYIQQAITMCQQSGQDPIVWVFKRFYANVMMTGARDVMDDIEFLKQKLAGQDERSDTMRQITSFIETHVPSLGEEHLLTVAIGIAGFLEHILPDAADVIGEEITDIPLQVCGELVMMGHDDDIPIALSHYFFGIYTSDYSKYITQIIELDLLTKRDSIIPAIKILKERYPESYNQSADFFERIVNPQKAQYLMDKYTNKFSRRGLGDDEFGGGVTYVKSQPDVGRNQACPCGSGKKFKKCCGKN